MIWWRDVSGTSIAATTTTASSVTTTIATITTTTTITAAYLDRPRRKDNSRSIG